MQQRQPGRNRRRGHGRGPDNNPWFKVAAEVGRTDLEPVCDYALTMFADSDLDEVFKLGNEVLFEETDHGKDHARNATNKAESVVIQVGTLRPGTFTPLDSLRIRITAFHHDTGVVHGKLDHAQLGARDTMARLQKKGFPPDIVADIGFGVEHHRTDDYLRVRLEDLDPSRRRCLAAVVIADKALECSERVRQDVRLQLGVYFGRKPSDFVGSQFAWLSQWRFERGFRRTRFLVEGNANEEVSACDVAGLGSLQEPQLLFYDCGREDGLLLCEIEHVLDTQIVTADEFMQLFGYRFVAFHYAALDLGCAFVARFRSAGMTDNETVSYVYDETKGCWQIETDLLEDSVEAA